MKGHAFYLIWLLFLYAIIPRFLAFTCIDDQGNPADSWVALKAAPNSSLYFVFNATSKSFVLSPYNVNQTKYGAIMETVNQLYSVGSSSAAYVLYNDEPPPDGSVSSSYAHAKGMLLTNASAGFWLVHSMPHWPNAASSGPAPFPDFTYGKSDILVELHMLSVDS